MSPSILKTSTSICVAVLMLQPVPGFAQSAAPVTQSEGVPCVVGQKDCKPVPPKRRKVPKTAEKAPDNAVVDAPVAPDAAAAAVESVAPTPKSPEQKPRAQSAPPPDTQPKSKSVRAPDKRVIQSAPAAIQPPEVEPAPAATTPDAEAKPVATQIPASKASDSRPAAKIQPAPAATARTRTTGTRLPGFDALGTNTDGRKRPPVATAAASAGAVIVPTVPAIKLGVRDVRRSNQTAPDGNTAQIIHSNTGLTDFEKFGLLALSAMVIGEILSNGQTVVSNSGDRVVVRDQNGSYGVMHDDNALVRRPGWTVTTQNYYDGSVLSRVVMADGTAILTLLDASGRILRRSVHYPNRQSVQLYDDTRPEIAYAPAYRPTPSPYIIYYTGQTSRASLLQDFLRPPPKAYGRTFSLRQVRDVPEIRGLVPQADLSTLTFATGSYALTMDQAQTLLVLGEVMSQMIARNSNEVFLIEGHTDAVGDVASNLALSDGRAESVALALTENFGVPPQNMVTQGYGESDLAVETQGASQANRRVVVRRITPLIETATPY